MGKESCNGFSKFFFFCCEEMNKAALITVGKRFQEDSMFLLSVFDLEPSGVIIHAYNQTDSKEYSLPVTEMEVKIQSSSISFFHRYFTHFSFLLLFLPHFFIYFDLNSLQNLVFHVVHQV